MKILANIACILLLVSYKFSYAATNPLHGFSLTDEAINPVCIQKIYPLLSDQSFIIRSIILEECQKSNFGFHNSEIKTQENAVFTNNADGLIKYEIIGKTDNNIFILFFNGNIAAYTINEKLIKSDLFKNEKKKAHILTVIGYSFVPCFKKAHIEGSILVIEKNIYIPNASRAKQCTDTSHVVKYKISQ
jgi:hypothetical protein